MAHSFSFNDTDMADYGITVVGGEWPFAKVGVTDTVNVPGMDGGYTYYNEAGPAEFTMEVICEGDDANDLIANLQSFAAATPASTVGKIYIDGITGYYWKARRVSDIRGLPVGMHALQFEIVWRMDEPGPFVAPVGT